MNDELESKRRGTRRGIGAVVGALAVVAGGVLFLVAGGFQGNAPRSEAGVTPTMIPAVATFIVDGMKKSRSGVT